MLKISEIQPAPLFLMQVKKQSDAVSFQNLTGNHKTVEEDINSGLKLKVVDDMAILSLNLQTTLFSIYFSDCFVVM